MLARWLPLAQGYGRVACRTSKARASRAAWSPSPAHARSRSVRAHAAGGWRISDNLGSGGGGSGGPDERPPGDEESFRGGRREGHEREGRERARAPSRGYDARPRDAYDSRPRGRSRGGRDDSRNHDPGFSSRDSSRDSSSSSREFGGRGRAGRGGRGGRGGARGGRGRGDRGGRGRGARASFRDDFRDESFYGVKRGGERDGRDERDESFYGGSDAESPAEFAGDSSHGSHDDQARPFHNADPSKRNDTGQNDWDCGACGADNFARRDACFRCGAARGAVETDRSVRPDGPKARASRDPDVLNSFEARAPSRDDSFKQRRNAGGGGDRWDVSREGVGSARESDGGSERAPIPAGCSRFYATCHPGLEEVVAAELRAFPIEALDVRAGASGVYFVGTKKTGVLANVWLRSAVRVLVELRHGWLDSSAPGGAAVYDFVRYAVPWPEVVPERTRSTFSFESRVWSCTDVTSTRLAVTRAKDAVCDALVDANGWRPPPPARGHASADVPMFLSLYRDEATLYRDMSGESLHRRGYRDAAIHRAALNESAAAGVLALAGWADACDKARQGESGADEGLETDKTHKTYALPVLVDPMCGSGTLLIEAALLAGMVAPGLVRADAARRRSARGGGFEPEGAEFEDDGRGGFVERAHTHTAYAFERWPDHDRAVLDEVLAEAEALGAEARRRGAKPVLIGNDRHGGALGLARRAAIAAGVDGMISFTQGDCGDLTHPALDAAREAEVAYFERLKYGESEKYGEGFVDLDALGPVTTRPGGGGVLVVSNPPWGKRLDVGGGRDADGQRRSAKRWGARERGGDGYGEEEAGDDFFLDARNADAEEAREEDSDSVGGTNSSLETFGEEDDDETRSAWQSLGVFFRRECAGATAHLLSGDAGATRPLRMRAKKKRVLGVGGVDCRLLEYRVLPPKREKNLADLAREAREEENRKTENRGGSEAVER